MEATGVRYSDPLKKKIMVLSRTTDLTAEEIKDKLQNMKRFKGEAKFLTEASIYGIRQRCADTDFDIMPSENGSAKATAKTPKALAEECLITSHGDRCTLSLSVPTDKVGDVLSRLGFGG